MLPQVQVLGGVYPGDHGHENPGAGSVRLSHLKTMVLIPQTRVSEVGSPGKCGCMSPNIQSGEDCHPGDCGHADTRCRVWQGVSQWRLWTYDPRFRVWEGRHPGDCGLVNSGAWSGGGLHRRLWICEPCALFGSPLPEDCGCVTPGSGSGRGVTMETVDM